NRAVIPDREAKTISHETTFTTNLIDRTVLRAWLLELTEQVTERLRRNQLLAKTVTLKVRFSNFETISRSKSFGSAVDSTNEIWESAAELLDRCPHRAVRLIGIGVSNMTRERTRQMDLFAETSAKDRKLDSVSDSIRSKFGRDALSRGTAGFRKRTDQ
ncbi:MAG: DNA polymerase IV, partial [Planctomycetaceae bacterium]